MHLARVLAQVQNGQAAIATAIVSARSLLSLTHTRIYGLSFALSLLHKQLYRASADERNYIYVKKYKYSC